jgi:hypothetical protein
LPKSLRRDKLPLGVFRHLEAILNIKLSAFAAAATLLLASSAHADCLAEIQAIMQNHLKAGPYHTTMESDMAGMKRTTEIDVILPSSFHMKAANMETIMLKEGTWMNMNGKWMVMPGNMSGMMEQNIKNGMESGFKNMANVQCEGPQTFEGKTLNKYEMDSTGEAMGIKATSHITMYTSDNGLPQVMLVDGEAMGHKSHTVQHISYDPSITITPPKLK